MLLDNASPPRERENVILAHREAQAVIRRHWHVLHHFSAADVIDEFEFLRAENFLENRTIALPKGGLEHIIFVGIHRALHHVFTEAVGGVDEHCVAKSALGVDGEHHPGSREVGAHHALDTDGERDLVVVESLVHAVGNRPVGEERRKAPLARFKQRRVRPARSDTSPAVPQNSLPANPPPSRCCAPPRPPVPSPRR